MAINYQIAKNFLQQQLQFGGAALNSLYPNDIEYYMLALELTTAQDATIDYFVFPVMPENIVRPMFKRINTKQSINSITTITSDSFTPFDLQIKGNFGRSFRIMLNSEPIIFTALRYSVSNGVYSKESMFSDTKEPKTSYNVSVKNGYGASKILNAIIDKSDGRDEQGAFKLYLYNPAFGESYLVMPTNNPLTWQQGVGKNMIWEYTLNLKVVSLLSGLKDNSDIQKKATYINSFHQVEKRMNGLASKTKNFVLNL